MTLNKMAKKDMDKASDLLANYWKNRGMPQYNKTWAKSYLAFGHKKEIKRDEFFTFKEHNKLIGIISLITDISNIAEIRDMVVKQEYRNKGYGKKMLKELLNLAKKRRIRKLYALVFPRTKKLYHSLGFKSEGLLKSHFAKGENLVIMSKFL